MQGSDNVGENNMRLIGKLGRAALFIAMMVLAFLVFFPILWMFRSSFMSTVEMYRFPPQWLPSRLLTTNYVDALVRQPFAQYTINTLTILLPVMAGTLITCSLAAYAFARLDFPGRKMWFALTIASMLMPHAITLIPIYLMWTDFRLVNTYWPLIIPSWLGGGAFNIFLMRQFMMTIPRDLDEAATIDGAGRARILVQVLLPLIKPVLVVISIFTFLNVWNDFLGPLVYVNTQEKYTVAIALALFKSEYKVDWGMLMAACCVVALPPMFVFIFGQRYIIEGITMTGLKA